MPSQSHANYRQRGDIKLCCHSSTSAAELDLDKKIDAITYQKPYTKKILTEMARANPQNGLNFVRLRHTTNGYTVA